MEGGKEKWKGERGGGSEGREGRDERKVGNSGWMDRLLSGRRGDGEREKERERERERERK